MRVGAGAVHGGRRRGAKAPFLRVENWRGSGTSLKGGGCTAMERSAEAPLPQARDPSARGRRWIVADRLRWDRLVAGRRDGLFDLADTRVQRCRVVTAETAADGAGPDHGRCHGDVLLVAELAACPDLPQPAVLLLRRFGVAGLDVLALTGEDLHGILGGGGEEDDQGVTAEAELLITQLPDENALGERLAHSLPARSPRRCTGPDRSAAGAFALSGSEDQAVGRDPTVRPAGPLGVVADRDDERSVDPDLRPHEHPPKWVRHRLAEFLDVLRLEFVRIRRGGRGGRGDDRGDHDRGGRCNGRRGGRGVRGATAPPPAEASHEEGEDDYDANTDQNLVSCTHDFLLAVRCSLQF